MKKLTCEMCGSTEMLKQDGVFICQTCGTKYSVEEAKKMMVEVEGAVSVKNAAQLDNLLKLAQSSYESKNYSQAEEFCNQVLAMDDKNYDAWKLKGEAINLQINAQNQRILEAYNCIMTSYRVLNKEEKHVKKLEVIFALRGCLEGEMAFWLDQFETMRPTDAMLSKVKNTYVDVYNKMVAAYDELELEGLKEGYFLEFENFFINKSVATCASAWQTTVGYNYYRDDFKNLGEKWGRGDKLHKGYYEIAPSNLVSRDIDSYRPTKDIAMTFLSEADNLIALLKFAEEQFNAKTSFEAKKKVYDNIIYIHERLLNFVYYKVGSYSTVVGWFEDGALSDEAKNIRKTMISIYKEKIEEAKNQYVGEVKEEKRQNSTKDIFEEAMMHIAKEEYIEAEACFDIIIEKENTSPVGYLGKGLVFLRRPEALIEATKKSIKEAIQYIPVRDLEKEQIVTIASDMTETGISLFMYVAALHDYETVEFLVSAGTDVNMKTGKGYTALSNVFWFNTSGEKLEAARKTVKILLDNGARVDVPDYSGGTILEHYIEPEIAQIIKEKYPDAELIENKPADKSSGGCYVATAVYGSYDCPQVWTLRRYRDEVLAKSWYGRAFIHTYYAISPTLVKWFGNKSWFKTMWQGKLDQMVTDLQSKGIESTPYKDKKWN